MQEVLFRKEIMCATRFSTSWVTHLRMTERNTTKRGYAIWKRKQDQCQLRRWLENDAGFVSRPDIFVRKVSTRCMTKKYGTLFIVVSPDGSLRRSADGLVDIHTNPPLSLEIKCLFHLHKGFQCILSSNPAYPAVYVIWSRWSFKVKATYFSVGTIKMVTVKCYVS